MSPEDAALWALMTDDVKPMPGRKKPVTESVPGPKRQAKKTPGKRTREPDNTNQSVYKRQEPKGRGLDRRTDERLRRGQMEIEARLDLHGLGRVRAEEALKAFIRRSYSQGKRCVLVITGKGRSVSNAQGEGVLRRAVPGWLQEGWAQDMVLKTHPAKARDGGAGAFYVLLARQRD